MKTLTELAIGQQEKAPLPSQHIDLHQYHQFDIDSRRLQLDYSIDLQESNPIIVIRIVARLLNCSIDLQESIIVIRIEAIDQNIVTNSSVILFATADFSTWLSDSLDHLESFY